jgi:excisionase family DNA binding protein
MTTREKAPPPQGVEPLIAASAVASWLGCSEDTVYRYTAEEGLPYVRRAGRRKWFYASEVQAWLDGRRTTVRKAPAPSPAAEQAAGGGKARAGAGLSLEDREKLIRDLTRGKR